MPLPPAQRTARLQTVQNNHQLIIIIIIIVTIIIGTN